MSVVSIAAQKGGPGKSTLTQSVAAVRASLKAKVAILDLDDQETTLIWGETRADDPSLPRIDVHNLKVNGKTKRQDALARRLDELLADYSDVFIDVGGKDTDLFRAALVLSDRIVVPMEPSPADLNTVPKLSALVGDLEASLGRKLPLSVLLNKSSGSPRMLREMKSGLEDYKDQLPLMRDMVGTRVAFKYAMDAGKGVHELTGKDFDAKAALEIKTVYLEIFGK